MNILLIQPKMNKRPMDTDLKTRMSPSLALLTLAGLTPEGHEVTLLNENLRRIDYGCNAKLVGITVTLDVLPRAVEIAREFRRRGIPVVAGGIHITCCPESCASFFDAICIGAAERVWAKIIQDAQNHTLQKVYHDMTGFTGSELVPPAYGKVDQRQYLFTNVVTTSRGCPNRCAFCYNSAKNRVYVRRPIEDVLADIRSIGTRHILFIDDNFIGSPAYARELVERLLGMDLIWSAAVTTKIGDDPELLDMMRDSGCQSLFIGFESINDMSLQGVDKDNRFAQYERLVKAIHSRGIMINASMVFGLDGDGPDVFRRTLDWLVKNRIETLTSHILTPYPGTALYLQMEAEGRIIDKDLSKYNTAHVVFTPKGMTVEALYRGYRKMYRQFYSFGNIVRRTPKHPAQRMPYWLFNFLYRKFGRITAVVARIMLMGRLGKWAASVAYRLEKRPVALHKDMKTIHLEEGANGNKHINLIEEASSFPHTFHKQSSA